MRSCGRSSSLTTTDTNTLWSCRRLHATNNGATATADKAKSTGPVPVVKIDNLSDPFATVVSAENLLGLCWLAQVVVQC